MKTWLEWATLTLFATMAVALVSFQLYKGWPAGDYTDAMAKGQYQKAREHLAAQVQQGNPEAITSLANLHDLGLGGQPDYPRASNLYHAAAVKGFGAAQLNLGHLYRQGLGVSKDVERAYAWYLQANIANNAWAEYYITQLSSELTLTPLQMATIKERFSKLENLAKEPL
ncbi:MAG: tetratricopeptide repeat protein [Granulosicoccus sp.]